MTKSPLISAAEDVLRQGLILLENVDQDSYALKKDGLWGASIGVTPEMPALFTTISIAPKRSAIRRIPASTLFCSRTSIVTAIERSAGKS